MDQSAQRAGRSLPFALGVTASVLLASCSASLHNNAKREHQKGVESSSTVPLRSSTTGVSTQRAPQPQQSVQFVNDEDGWLIVGLGLEATSDGGRTWHSSYAGHDIPKAIDFISPDDGWMVADAPMPQAVPIGLLRTINGGQSWTTLGEPSGRLLMDVSFLGPSTGWALTTSGTLLATTDGGSHWSHVGSPIAGSLCVVANGRLWLGTVTGVVDDSVNNGTTWIVSLPSAVVSTVFSGGVPPWMTCSGEGAWALYDLGEAAGSASYIVFGTDDDGSHWAPVLANDDDGSVESLPSVSNSVADDGVMGDGSAWFLGYCGACGDSGTAEIVTASASNSVHTVELPAVAGGASLDASFVDATDGWVVGTGAVPAPSGGYPLDVLATTDSGTTWHVIATLPAES
jgi:photosystem II stability/assembly factor-like uncharacterized protein